MLPLDYHHTTLVVLAGTKEANSVQEAKFAVWYQQCDVYINIYIYIHIHIHIYIYIYIYMRACVCVCVCVNV